MLLYLCYLSMFVLADKYITIHYIEKKCLNCICLFLVINVIKTSNKCSEWCDKTSVFSAFYHFYYYIFFCLRFKCLAVFISNLNFNIKCVPFPNTIVSKWTSTYICNYFYYSIFFSGNNGSNGKIYQLNFKSVIKTNKHGQDLGLQNLLLFIFIFIF